MYEISGLQISPFKTMEDAVNFIVNTDGSVNDGFAVAVNAEKIISMRKNKDVRDILESATLRYSDGIGVVWALRKKGANCNRISGCDLWQKLMKKAGQINAKVYLVGATSQVMDQTLEKLYSQFNLEPIGAQHGYFDSEEGLVEKIVASNAEIVTVALGSPAQEKFIAKCRVAHPNAFYMGVGGTYDVYVGNVKRAPEWAQRYNIEWLYRVTKQPGRILRQPALLKFLILLLLNNL